MVIFFDGGHARPLSSLDSKDAKNDNKQSFIFSFFIFPVTPQMGV